MNIGYIFGFIASCYIFKYLIITNKNHTIKKKKLINNKKKFIRPQSETINKYDDFVEFLFSIQDLYVYNPPAYEELVDSITDFLNIYEECINNNAMANLNYSVMEMRRNNAIGTLQSIIIKAPTNITNKISRATIVLDNMMVEYLKEIKLILKKILLINGYNTKTKIIDNSNIRPYNYVESKNYTFDCF